MLNQKLIISAIALAALTFLSACGDGSQTTAQSVTEQDILLNVATVTHNVDSFIEQSVLVRNDILEPVGDRGFILDKDSVFSGGTILVINASSTPFKVPEDETPEVLVRGEVQLLDLEQVQQQYGLNLEKNIYGKYEGKPVILATSIILSPDPEDLTNDPEKYYGKYVAIEGTIEDVEDFGIFELDEKQAFGGEDLLVVQLKPKRELQEDQTAIVYGVLRPFISVELEKDYDLDWDLSVQEQIEAEYSQKPILIARKIVILQSLVSR